MPTGTRVHRCVNRLKKEHGLSAAIGICQKSTKQSYRTGRTLRKRRTKRRSRRKRGGGGDGDEVWWGAAAARMGCRGRWARGCGPLEKDCRIGSGSYADVYTRRVRPGIIIKYAKGQATGDPTASLEKMCNIWINKEAHMHRALYNLAKTWHLGTKKRQDYATNSASKYVQVPRLIMASWSTRMRNERVNLLTQKDKEASCIIVAQRIFRPGIVRNPPCNATVKPQLIDNQINDDLKQTWKDASRLKKPNDQMKWNKSKSPYWLCMSTPRLWSDSDPDDMVYDDRNIYLYHWRNGVNYSLGDTDAERRVFRKYPYFQVISSSIVFDYAVSMCLFFVETYQQLNIILDDVEFVIGAGNQQGGSAARSRTYNIFCIDFNRVYNVSFGADAGANPLDALVKGYAWLMGEEWDKHLNYISPSPWCFLPNPYKTPTFFYEVWIGVGKKYPPCQEMVFQFLINMYNTLLRNRAAYNFNNTDLKVLWEIRVPALQQQLIQKWDNTISRLSGGGGDGGAAAAATLYSVFLDCWGIWYSTSVFNEYCIELERAGGKSGVLRAGDVATVLSEFKHDVEDNILNNNYEGIHETYKKYHEEEQEEEAGYVFDMWAGGKKHRKTRKKRRVKRRKTRRRKHRRRRRRKTRRKKY